MISVTSNTRECFRTFIGQRVVGFLFDALPNERLDLAAGTKTIIFEDGRGLTISNTGSYWVNTKDEVTRAIAKRHDELTTVSNDIAEVLTMAGALANTKV